MVGQFPRARSPWVIDLVTCGLVDVVQHVVRLNKDFYDAVEDAVAHGVHSWGGVELG